MRTLRMKKLSEIRKESQEQKIVTKNFGQRVDFYSHFNLYNDTKSSVYFEQKGRTVGDVDFAPGSTISGCLTNTDFVIYFTNLNGGKDSITVTSNQLRMAVPSAKVKPGELDPTLNLSSFSMSKFAGMRKNAADQIPNEVTKFFEFLDGFGYFNRGDGLYAKEFLIEKSTGNTIITALSWIKNNKNAASKEYAAKYSGLQTGGLAGNLNFGIGDSLDEVLSNFKKTVEQNILGYRPPIKDKLKDLSSKISEAISGSATGAATEPGKPSEDAKKQKQPASGGGAARRSTVSGNVTTTPLAAPSGTILKDEKYTYKIIDQYSFEFSTDGTTYKKVMPKTFSKWNDAAANLNTLFEKTKAATPAAATQSAATGTPTAATPAAETPAAGGTKVFEADPKLVSNVAIILQNASTRAYAMTVPGNQKKQIKNMLRSAGVAATVAGIQGVTNPSEFLAKLLIAKIGAGSLSSIGSIQNISNMSEGDIKGAAKEEVRRLMFAVNELYNQYGADDYSRMNMQFASVMRRGQAAAAAPAQAPTTPAVNPATAPQAAAGAPADTAANAASATPPVTPPASSAPAAQQKDNADDGMTKKKSSQSIDPRIKKLATLRRLRVRSQMEAAVEASSMFGRSRVS